MNYSSIVNELVRLGLMVYKSKEEGNLSISKVSGATSLRKSPAHEGIMILTALVSDIFVKMKGPDSG
jgi:hypothetical protein